MKTEHGEKKEKEGRRYEEMEKGGRRDGEGEPEVRRGALLAAVNSFIHLISGA